MSFKIQLFTLLILIAVSSCQVVNIVEKPGKEDPKVKRYDLIELFENGTANVTFEGKWGAIDTNGKEIIPLVYDGIMSVYGEKYSFFTKANKMGLLDKQGKILVPASFDEIFYIQSNRLGVKIGGLWGVIDEKGNEIIANQFEEIFTTVNNIAIVSRDGKSGLVDILNGEILLACTYDYIDSYNASSASSFAVMSDLGWGVYNIKQAKEVLACTHDFVEILNDKLFSVQFHGYDDQGNEWTKKGVFNDQNQQIIPAEYQQIFFYKDDQIVLGAKDSSYSIFKVNGSLIAQVEDWSDVSSYDDAISNQGIISIKTGGIWKFIDTTGNWLRTIPYDGTLGFDESGFALVCHGCDKRLNEFGDYYWKGGIWGIIDVVGKEVINPKYNSIDALVTQNSRTIVNDSCVYDSEINYCSGGKFGVVDARSSKEIIATEYNKIFLASDGLIVVNKSVIQEGDNYTREKWGLYDSLGNEIIPPQYNELLVLEEENIAFVYLKGKIGIIDYSGRILTNLVYDKLAYFQDGMYIAAKKRAENDTIELPSAEYWLIDRDGNFLINQSFEELYYESGDDKLIAKKNGKYGVIDKTGKALIPFEFDYITRGESFDTYLVNIGCDPNNNWEGGKFGIYKVNGTIVFPAIYDEIQDYSIDSKFYILRQQGKYGMANIKGKSLTPIIFDQIVNSYQDILPVEKDGKFGALNSKGEIVLPIVYDLANYLYGNEFFLAKKDGSFYHED
ncbi:MAG: WG repeat-containing protein [Bacteroidota bacterium]